MRVEPETRDPLARAEALVRLFCSPGNFGAIRSVAPSQVPEPARTLLDHHSHMTVAMERFHGGDVRLRVVASVNDGSGKPTHPAWYAREILLETQGGKIVQHGIVRIDLTTLNAAAAQAIREARRPLGRILIEAGMLREVHSVSLLEVEPGPHLNSLFRLPDRGAAAADAPVYGRVADIQLDGRPAVELLEIVAPAT
jgi:chorismate-pyruvate lyase